MNLIEKSQIIFEKHNIDMIAIGRQFSRNILAISSENLIFVDVSSGDIVHTQEMKNIEIYTGLFEWSPNGHYLLLMVVDKHVDPILGMYDFKGKQLYFPVDDEMNAISIDFEDDTSSLVDFIVWEHDSKGFILQDDALQFKYVEIKHVKEYGKLFPEKRSKIKYGRYCMVNHPSKPLIISYQKGKYYSEGSRRDKRGQLYNLVVTNRETGEVIVLLKDIKPNQFCLMHPTNDKIMHFTTDGIEQIDIFSGDIENIYIPTAVYFCKRFPSSNRLLVLPDGYPYLFDHPSQKEEKIELGKHYHEFWFSFYNVTFDNEAVYLNTLDEKIYRIPITILNQTLDETN